jgi:hypothetical protein
MAANVSKLGMADFGNAMAYAGAPAAALGVNIESLATAMAVMSNKGLDASTIGTSLRSMFSRLASPPKAAADAIEQVGLKVTDTQGKFVGMESIISQLRQSMSGMTDTQQVAIAKAIAGEEAYSGLLDLIKTSPEEYEKVTSKISHASGSSAEAFGQMQNTLKGSVDAFKGALESLGISFGEIMAPSIKSAADSITKVVTWLNNLSPEQKSMIADIAKGIVMFTGFNYAMGKAVGFGGSLVKLYGNIGIAARGGSIQNKLLQYSIQGITKIWPNLSSGVGKFVGIIGRLGKLGFTGFISAIKMACSALGLLSKAFISTIIAGGPILWVIMAIAAAAMLIYANWDKVGPIFKAAWDEVVNTCTWAYNGVRDFINECIEAFSGFVNWISSTFTNAWSGAWNGIVNIFQSIFNGVSSVCDKVVEGIKSAINSVIGGINSIQVDIPSWVPKVGGSHFGLNIPYLYRGTDNWNGGMAVINDRGGEIVDLPSGARVIPHEQSLNQAYNAGARSGRGGGITVNIINPSMNNSSDIKKLGEQVAREILYQMEKRAIVLNEGAI